MELKWSYDDKYIYVYSAEWNIFQLIVAFSKITMQSFFAQC